MKFEGWQHEVATNLGISNYQGMCPGSPWNQGKAGPNLGKGLREKSNLRQGSWLTLLVLQAAKLKLPGTPSSPVPLMSLVWCMGRESTDVATCMLLVFLACDWKWHVGRVARA